jgi:hypothetical protein
MLRFRALMPQSFSDANLEKLISGFNQLKLTSDEISDVELEKYDKWGDLSSFQKQNMIKLQNFLKQGINLRKYLKYQRTSNYRLKSISKRERWKVF